MKKRIFSGMDNGVFRVVITTEDWSEGDVELMEQFGEPEIDVGGSVSYEYNDASGNAKTGTREFGSEYVRLLHGFPYARGFDSRDYESVAEAVAAGSKWKEIVAGENGVINKAVLGLRANSSSIPTEEVYEI